MSLLRSGAYDVVIAGASFAGLAVASRLRGRVLLIDRAPIGAAVTSACAAPVRVLEALGASGAIQQRHDVLVLHTPGRQVVWPLPEPFCTFDYAACCEAAAREAGIGGRAAFLLASVRGRADAVVLTSAGPVRSRVLVDATGPRAALAGPRTPRYAAFGIESEVPVPVGPGLHFYFVPEVRDGYAWAFGCGAATRFGVLSYRGRTKLRPALARFMARFGAAIGRVHGGFLATGWADPVAGDVFVVGDAGGHCLPMTGEGIRTAVWAGLRCGTLIQRVLDGTLSVAAARAAYRAVVAADRRRYRALLAANLLLLALPRRGVGAAAAALARPAVLRWFMRHYLGILRPPASEAARDAPDASPPRVEPGVRDVLT